MITIDGSQGEGGGQILRTSLALSLVTGQPFRMERVRAKRQKPGLLKQHLTAVEAAKTVGGAEADGASLSSQTLEFRPGPVTPGNYRFAVGTAGSATLVLQTVLPALLTASGHSALTLEGGTHNPMAPPFDFLARCFLPLIHRMGPSVELELRRHGFFPAGGGQFHARIEPAKKLSRLDLPERGSIRNRQAQILVSKLPEHIGQRELTVVRDELEWRADECGVEVIQHSTGPGNAVVLAIETEHVTEVFTGFGERGRPAEDVARGDHWKQIASLGVLICPYTLPSPVACVRDAKPTFNNSSGSSFRPNWEPVQPSHKSLSALFRSISREPGRANLPF